MIDVNSSKRICQLVPNVSLNESVLLLSLFASTKVAAQSFPSASTVREEKIVPQMAQ